MVITLHGRPMGIYPFRIFHTSLGSTLCTESKLKNDLTVESVPSLVLEERTDYNETLQTYQFGELNKYQTTYE